MDAARRAARGGVGSFCDVLEQRATTTPDRTAYVHIREDGRDRLTYGEIDSKARGFAAALQARVRRGARAVLAYPAGLEFVVAVFGCFHAGVIAVPVAPPRRGRPDDRFQAIVGNVRPACIIGNGDPPADASAGPPDVARLSHSLLMAEGDPTAAPRGPGDIALLQPTSGTTSSPRCVTVSHANLMQNARYVAHVFRLSADDVSVTWLPNFHDMGLVEGILVPLHCGFPEHILSPITFVHQPVAWLRAISEVRATHSGGPDFAYRHCVDRIRPEQCDALDLGSWATAYSGAEPVQATTIDAFVERFARHGFARRAFSPCYGLAEATLMVTGGTPRGGPVTYDADARELERHRVVAPAPGTPRPVRLVSCGSVHLDTRIAVVDPATRRRAAGDRIGEIWVRGPGVAAGYWRRPDASRRTFRARLADTGAGPFLRTGDLGFLRDGELFLVGRLKDRLVVKGRNIDPQWLETTAAACHDALAGGRAAAFLAGARGAGPLVIAVEVARHAQRDVEGEAVARAVRRSIAEDHALHAGCVVLLRPNAIPRTSSGKVERYRCRRLFAAGGLGEIFRSVDDAEGSRAGGSYRLRSNRSDPGTGPACG